MPLPAPRGCSGALPRSTGTTCCPQVRPQGARRGSGERPLQGTGSLGRSVGPLGAPAWAHLQRCPHIRGPREPFGRGPEGAPCSCATPTPTPPRRDCAAPRLPQPDHCTSPRRTRPGVSPRQGVATPAARPAAARLPGWRPEPTSLTPARGHLRRGLGGGRGPRRCCERRQGRPTGTRPTASRASRRPAPFQRPPPRGPVGGVRAPGLLATRKQGQVRPGLELAGDGRGRVRLPVSARVALACFRGPLASGGSLHRLASGGVRLPPGGGR